MPYTNHAETTRPHVIHIGLHKTGSTWLQQFVFPWLSGLSFDGYQGAVRSLTQNLTVAEDDAFVSRRFH